MFQILKTVQGQDQARFDQDLKKMVLRPVLRPRPVLRTTSLAVLKVFLLKFNTNTKAIEH